MCLQFCFNYLDSYPSKGCSASGTNKAGWTCFYHKSYVPHKTEGKSTGIHETICLPWGLYPASMPQILQQNSAWTTLNVLQCSFQVVFTTYICWVMQKVDAKTHHCVWGSISCQTSTRPLVFTISSSSIPSYLIHTTFMVLLYFTNE